MAAFILPLSGVAALGELDTYIDQSLINKRPPQNLKVNKQYFHLYQIGFLLVESVILVTLIYMLLIRPFYSTYKALPQ